ncbi:hypothetical protein HDU78_006396 [Chytriomyces hyalinus]|nr:hypothetical protein HDU78_006396 [Chytriomyces hyalinus]
MASLSATSTFTLDKCNAKNRVILRNEMSKQDALAQARLAHTAQLILQQIQDHPFLLKPPSALNALDASELPSFRHIPFMWKYSLHLPPAAADIPQNNIIIIRKEYESGSLFDLHESRWYVRFPVPVEHIEKASAFIERHAEMETHQAYISQFEFPKKEKYWGILSHKSRERIKDLAASEWACLHTDNLFVTERDAMLDSLKKEKKAENGSVKYPVRKSELHSSKRVERRSEMKRALAFMGCK